MPLEFSFKWGKKSSGYTPTQHTTPSTVSTGNLSADSISIDISNALAYFGNPQTAIIWAYSNIAEFGSPIDWVKDGAADIPILHERLVNGKWEEVKNSEIKKLLDIPNQFQTKGNYKEDFYLNLLLTGENFVNNFVPSGFSKATKLYVFQSNLVQVDYTNSTASDFRTKEVEKYLVNGGATEILPDGMTYRKEVNKLQEPTERGVSILVKLANTAKDLQAGTEASITTKETKGAGILTPKQNEVFEQGDQVTATKAFRSRYGLTGGKDPVVMIGKSLDYTPISMNVGEMGLTESQLTNLRNVCATLKISSQLVGDSKASTYNNLKVIKSSLYTDAIQPRVKYFCEFHQDMFGLNGETERLRGDYSDIDALQADRKINNDIANQQYQANIITGDEWRVEDGKDEMGLGFKNDTTNEQ